MAIITLTRFVKSASERLTLQQVSVGLLSILTMSCIAEIAPLSKNSLLRRRGVEVVQEDSGASQLITILLYQATTSTNVQCVPIYRLTITSTKPRVSANNAFKER